MPTNRHFENKSKGYTQAQAHANIRNQTRRTPKYHVFYQQSGTAIPIIKYKHQRTDREKTGFQSMQQELEK